MMNKYNLKKNNQLVGNMILIIFYVISYSFSLSLRQINKQLTIEKCNWYLLDIFNYAFIEAFTYMS
jgi:hypothetical protein